MAFRLRFGFGIRRREKCILYLICLIFIIICMGGIFYLPQENEETNQIGIVEKIQRIFRQKSPNPIKPPKKPNFGKLLTFIIISVCNVILKCLCMSIKKCNKHNIE